MQGEPAESIPRLQSLHAICERTIGFDEIELFTSGQRGKNYRKKSPFSGDQVTGVSAGLAFSLHSEFESVEGHAGRGLGYGNGGSNHLITPRCRHNAFNGLNGPQGSGSRRIHKICPLNGIPWVWATQRKGRLIPNVGFVRVSEPEMWASR